MKISIILFLLLIPILNFGQSYIYNFNQFEVKSNFGISLPSSSSMKYLVRSNIFVGEFNYSVKTDGSKHWHNVWRCPELGVGYLAGGLGNKDILGFSHSLFAFWGVPIIEKEKIILKYRFGTGIAYITKKFDYQHNYYNIADGANFNSHLYFALLLDVKPLEFPLYITTGLTFNHYSSWGICSPDLGLNQLCVNFGMKYLYSQYPYSLMKRLLPYRYGSELEISAYYILSTKKNNIFEKNKFINSLAFDVAARTSEKRSWGGGIVLVIDPSLKTLLEQQDKYKNYSNIFRLGIHLHNELYLTEDLSILLQAGVYVLNKYKSDDKLPWLYTKSGLRYTFSNNIFMNILFKTQAKTRDNIEFGIGYRIVNSR